MAYILYTFSSQNFNRRKHLELQSEGKGNVIPVLGRLSTTPWRYMEERSYSSTCSWPRYKMEVSGQLHALVALLPGTLGTHWLGGWVGRRADLNAVKKIEVSCPCRESSQIPLTSSPYLDCESNIKKDVILKCGLRNSGRRQRSACKPLD
jgi:hypothetical protein